MATRKTKAAKASEKKAPELSPEAAEAIANDTIKGAAPKANDLTSENSRLTEEQTAQLRAEVAQQESDAEQARKRRRRARKGRYLLCPTVCPLRDSEAAAASG